METLSLLPVPQKFLHYDDFTPAPPKFDQDISFKLEIDHNNNENFKEEQQEFSFSRTNSHESLVPADEIFDKGRFRPTFPIPEQSPRRSRFCESEGAYCEMLRETTTLDSERPCKKSHSTGFAMMRRSKRNRKLRSYSDGRIAFDFLNASAPAKTQKVENIAGKKRNGAKHKTTPSCAHEEFYAIYRMRKESEKRRSFLPYRKGLLGFFINGFCQESSCFMRSHPVTTKREKF